MNNVKENVRNNHYNGMYLTDSFFSLPLQIRASMIRNVTKPVNFTYSYVYAVLEFEEVYGVKS